MFCDRQIRLNTPYEVETVTQDIRVVTGTQSNNRDSWYRL